MPVEPMRVFHPVQHQFKITETMMEQYAIAHGGTRCRRSDSEDEDGVLCKDPAPQTLYPACYPAAWASLCSSYLMTPLHPRRRWELGTPNEDNPPPNEFGDFFSTWAMGTEVIGAPPPVSRVEDWQADTADPTPTQVSVPQQEFQLEDGDPDEDKIRRRAALIKRYFVGGFEDPARPVDSRPTPRPVLIRHQGHAWNIVGVDKDGFWAHAQNPDAWGFSDWCLWEHARWLKTNSRAWIHTRVTGCLPTGLRPQASRAASRQHHPPGIRRRLQAHTVRGCQLPYHSRRGRQCCEHHQLDTAHQGCGHWLCVD